MVMHVKPTPSLCQPLIGHPVRFCRQVLRHEVRGAVAAVRGEHERVVGVVAHALRQAEPDGAGGQPGPPRRHRADAAGLSAGRVVVAGGWIHDTG